jgi:ribose 5-phosphate isomerase A
MDPKQRAAEAAIEFVRSDTVIGLGSGSTADFFLVALADALKSGRLRNVVGVPTSEQTARRSAELGIPLTTLSQSPVLDVDVDGADEVTPALDLIKGLGGAMLREKIVAQHATRFVIIGDGSKRVEKLGTRAPLPVEVAKFEHEATAKWLESLGCTAQQRMAADGPYVTDNGNDVYLCRFPRGIDDPRALDAALAARAGVIETGLFLGMATAALIAENDRVITMRK